MPYEFGRAEQRSLEKYKQPYYENILVFNPIVYGGRGVGPDHQIIDHNSKTGKKKIFLEFCSIPGGKYGIAMATPPDNLSNRK